MRISPLLFALALASFTLAAPMANAAHLSCNNTTSTPNTDLVGYDFTISVAVSSGGGGGGAGKPTSSLIVTLPINASIVPLGQFVEDGRHSSTCTLSEPGSGIEFVMHDVIFSRLEIVNGPNAVGKTTTVAMLTLNYAKEETVTVP